MKKINIYYVFDCLLSAALMCLFLSKKGMGFFYVAWGLAITTAILVFLETKEETQLTQTIVANESEDPVFFKPENESEPLTLAPHTSSEGIDGIKFCGRVYKLCNGTHVIIDSNNKITTKALTGKFANLTRGGVLTSPPDPSWQPLFDA